MVNHRINSWISSANNGRTPFPLNNLPCGVFSTPSQSPRCGVAIGTEIIDVAALERAGTIELGDDFLQGASWNAFMAAGTDVWSIFRERLIELFRDDSNERNRCESARVSADDARLHMPFTVAEYTDFYAGRHHATHVGTMMRGAENALPPNWLHMPIGYNGRASSVVVSGTPIKRPYGQIAPAGSTRPTFAPSRRFDMELELGAVVGPSSNRPLSVAEADANIFGYVLLNDWSARDIQAWEYQPLGPFQAKATATTIGPWIVMKAALEPFRTDTPPRDFALLEYLREPGPMLYDIDLQVTIQTTGMAQPQLICQTNYKEMYYSAAQQLAHHTSSGCPMRTGDLLGSGTISGPKPSQRGSFLELSNGGKDPIQLEGGGGRSFLDDEDTIVMTGFAKAQDYRVGFGECVGTIVAADEPAYPGLDTGG